MRSHLFAAVLVSLLAVSCSKKQPPLIEVGKRSADYALVEKRLEQVQLLRPEYTRGQVAAGLIEGWVADAILEKRGKNADYDALVQERSKLEKDEKIARLFREVARVYGNDSEGFMNAGLLPDISLRRVHELFDAENAAQNEGQEKAAILLRKAQENAAAFDTAATEAGARLQKISIANDGTVTNTDGRQIRVFTPNAGADNASAIKVLNIGRRSEPGAVLGLVLRTDGGYLVMRRLEDSPNSVAFQTAVFSNTTFGEWLLAEAKKLQADGELRVCINDAPLRSQYEQAAAYNFIHCPE